MLTTALDTSDAKENESSQHSKQDSEISEVDDDAESSDITNCSSAIGHVLPQPKPQPGGDDGQVHCCLKPLVSYEAFVWVFFIATTTLAIVDRLTTNAWPRQAFSIGSGSAGNDRTGELCVLF